MGAFEKLLKVYNYHHIHKIIDIISIFHTHKQSINVCHDITLCLCVRALLPDTEPGVLS